MYPRDFFVQISNVRLKHHRYHNFVVRQNTVDDNLSPLLKLTVCVCVREIFRVTCFFSRPSFFFFWYLENTERTRYFFPVRSMKEKKNKLDRLKSYYRRGNFIRAPTAHPDYDECAPPSTPAICFLSFSRYIAVVSLLYFFSLSFRSCPLHSCFLVLFTVSCV